MIYNPTLFDIESYGNYFLICFYELETKAKRTFELKARNDKIHPHQKERIMSYLNGRTLVGYNCDKFDIFMLLACLKGFTCHELAVFSQSLIDGTDKMGNKVPFYDIARSYDIERIRHIKTLDLFFCNGNIPSSLKTYAARLCADRVVSLPIKIFNEFGEFLDLTSDEMQSVKDYCWVDIEATKLLYNHLEFDISLRVRLSKEYRLNLLSCSNQAIAENVLIHSIRDFGVECRKGNFTKKSFKLTLGKGISFEAQHLKDHLRDVATCDYLLKEGEASIIAPQSSFKTIRLGDHEYECGLGGIHSTDKSLFIQSNNLYDFDVGSYYPVMIMQNHFNPYGEYFRKVYGDIVERRLNIKKNDPELAGALKIVIVSSFGKMQSEYSYLYDPENFTNITVNGQLYILMLIEQGLKASFTPLSANTDGVTGIVTDMKAFEEVARDWEQRTGFSLEKVKYNSYFRKDVNNYFAVREDGYIKSKGVFSIGGFNKNWDEYIVYKSIIDKVTTGRDIEETIMTCKDLHLFLKMKSGKSQTKEFTKSGRPAKKTTGEFYWDGKLIGKVARWVYVKDGNSMHYEGHKGKVPDSDGSLPIFSLNKSSDDFEAGRINLDYSRYIEKALKLYNSVAK